jgi:hypothetical protein
MARIQSYYILELQKRYIDNEVLDFKKNIAEAKPKYYQSAIQGPASALRCGVLGCCSWGGLPSLFPNIRLATGPHPLATTVTKPWQLYAHNNKHEQSLRN